MGLIGYCFLNEQDLLHKSQISYFYKFIPNNGHNYAFQSTTMEYGRQMLAH